MAWYRNIPCLSFIINMLYNGFISLSSHSFMVTLTSLSAASCQKRLKPTLRSLLSSYNAPKLLILALHSFIVSLLILLGDRTFYLQNLSLRRWHFLHVDPGHWVPACVRVSRSITRTVTYPESHAHSAFGDFLTHPFNMARTVQVLLGAVSIYHIDHAINRLWSWALGSVECEISSSAAGMAIIDAKVAIPVHKQTRFFWLFIKETFLQK